MHEKLTKLWSISLNTNSKNLSAVYPESSSVGIKKMAPPADTAAILAYLENSKNPDAMSYLRFLKNIIMSDYHSKFIELLIAKVQEYATEEQSLSTHLDNSHNILNQLSDQFPKELCISTNPSLYFNETEIARSLSNEFLTLLYSERSRANILLHAQKSKTTDATRIRTQKIDVLLGQAGYSNKVLDPTDTSIISAFVSSKINGGNNYIYNKRSVIGQIKGNIKSDEDSFKSINDATEKFKSLISDYIEAREFMPTCQVVDLSKLESIKILLENKLRDIDINIEISILEENYNLQIRKDIVKALNDIKSLIEIESTDDNPQSSGKYTEITSRIQDIIENHPEFQRMDWENQNNLDALQNIIKNRSKHVEKLEIIQAIREKLSILESLFSRNNHSSHEAKKIYDEHFSDYQELNLGKGLGLSKLIKEYDSDINKEIKLIINKSKTKGDKFSDWLRILFNLGDNELTDEFQRLTRDNAEMLEHYHQIFSSNPPLTTSEIHIREIETDSIRLSQLFCILNANLEATRSLYLEEHVANASNTVTRSLIQSILETSPNFNRRSEKIKTIQREKEKILTILNCWNRVVQELYHAYYPELSPVINSYKVLHEKAFKTKRALETKFVDGKPACLSFLPIEHNNHEGSLSKTCYVAMSGPTAVTNILLLTLHAMIIDFCKTINQRGGINGYQFLYLDYATLEINYLLRQINRTLLISKDGKYKPYDVNIRRKILPSEDKCCAEKKLLFALLNNSYLRIQGCINMALPIYAQTESAYQNEIGSNKHHKDIRLTVNGDDRQPTLYLTAKSVKCCDDCKRQKCATVIAVATANRESVLNDTIGTLRSR